MPRMDGLEATAAIRSWESQRGSRTPIIAMTAHAMKGDRERCLQAGMDGYIAKPIRAEDLLAIIDQHAPAAQDSVLTREKPADWQTPLGIPELLLRVDGHNEILVELVELFFKESLPLMQEIRDAVRNGDSRQLEFTAHKLKGSVAVFGMQSATGAMADLEQIGRAGNLDNADSACSRAERELTSLTRALANLKQELCPQKS